MNQDYRIMGSEKERRLNEVLCSYYSNLFWCFQLTYFKAVCSQVFFDNIRIPTEYSYESPSSSVTHHTKYLVELPSFPSFEWDFFVIDTTKGEHLILVFDFLNHLNPYIDWRKRLITFHSHHKDYDNPSNSFRNEFSSANTCAVLVADSRTPSSPTSVHVPSPNSPQSFLPSLDELFKEIKYFGEYSSIYSLHLFHGNVDLPPSSNHDSLE
ncbi:hypothetical protein O181_093813 [Austropuccinia psidii MF-1]|uniref:Uncharacterized protein n=1 Tax=Austropuccinia psidii MF-1 TaxID=1389203 RepID=A0A9Q3J1Y1_9BASI|nr:hypothetical protein [Austropuccinia psidii MF-1]